jgi:hypothetical protein
MRLAHAHAVRPSIDGAGGLSSPPVLQFTELVSTTDLAVRKAEGALARAIMARDAARNQKWAAAIANLGKGDDGHSAASQPSPVPSVEGGRDKKPSRRVEVLDPAVAAATAALEASGAIASLNSLGVGGGSGSGGSIANDDSLSDDVASLLGGQSLLSMPISPRSVRPGSVGSSIRSSRSPSIGVTVDYTQPGPSPASQAHAGVALATPGVKATVFAMPSSSDSGAVPSPTSSAAAAAAAAATPPLPPTPTTATKGRAVLTTTLIPPASTTPRGGAKPPTPRPEQAVLRARLRSLTTQHFEATDRLQVLYSTQRTCCCIARIDLNPPTPHPPS